MPLVVQDFVGCIVKPCPPGPLGKPREIELADETASAEGKPALAQSDDLRFDVDGSLAGLVMRSAGQFEEAAWSLRLLAAQPLAHGGDGGLKKTGGGLEASLSGRLNQTPTTIVGVSHLANQDEVAVDTADCNPGRWPPGLGGAVRPAP